jgi:hypothetical protein
MKQSAVLLCLAAGALAAGRSSQKEMPLHAGVLPGQKVVQLRFEKGSAHLPEAEVRAALAGATRAWNAALPADLKLVETPMSQPYPAGEVVIMVRFDSDPSHFGKSGIDEVGDIRGIIDRQKNHAIVALFLVDKPGVLVTNGAAAGHDLQLVMMHELGHALGLQHDDGGTGLPPIMAEALEENGKLLARTGKTLAGLRQITATDKLLLDIAMAIRKSRDVSGSYTGTLEVTKVVKGLGSLPIGQKLPVREGDFVVTFDAGMVKVDYKGSKREVPALDLLDDKFKLRFPDVDDGKTLRTMIISRGNTPEEILVEAMVEPMKTRYEIKGTLKRK